MKNISLLLVSFVIYSHLLAQDKIQADRPGETLTPHLINKGFFQFEVGTKKDQQNRTDYSITHPELQIKYGVSKRFELRAEFFTETEREYSRNEFKYGLRPVEIGFKANLTQEKGLLPLTTLYTQIGIPKFASEDHQTSQVISRIKLLFENQLTETLHLNYNVGTEWTGDDTKPRWMYSIDQEIELSKKWELFLETFAHFQQGEAARHHIDGGLSFFPSPHVKLDVYGGKGLSAEAPDYFISAGISFRLR